MQAYPAVWGIDIGHATIKAIKMVRSGSEATVTDYSIEPIEIEDGGDREEAFEKAMVALVQREDLRTLPVVISLSGSQSFSKIVNVPVLSENQKNLRKMVELEAREAIPGDLDDLYWQYHVVPALDGESMDVALFAARKDLVRHLVELCGRLGLELGGISISSLAIYNFVRFDQDFDFDETVAVLDVGADNTELLVYQGESLWMRSLTTSGNAITRAFQKKFRVSMEEAEKLKTQVEDSRQADKILKVIEPNLMELVTELTRSFGFYRQSNREANFETLVVAGNTFRLPGLDQFMANRLNMAILSLIELERIQIDDGMDREHFLEDLQSLGVALGLGLQGLGLADANIDLLPKEVFVQNTLAKKRWAMVAILLMLPLAHVVRDRMLSSQMANNWKIKTDIEAIAAEVAKEEKAVRPVTGEIGKAAQKLASFRELGKGGYAIGAAERGLWQALAAAATDVEAQKVYFEGGANAIVTRDPSNDKGDPILLPAYVTEVSVGNVDKQPRKLRELYDMTRKTLPSATVEVAIFHGDTNVARLMRQNVVDHLEAATYPEWRVAIAQKGVLDDVEEPLPPLIGAISDPNTQPGFDLSWTYIDPSFEDRSGNIIERRERRQMPTPRLISYTLEFASAAGGK